MGGAVTDYAECRAYIVAFYKDRYALLGEVEKDLNDAYDYFQDFLREGLKPDATEDLFWAAFGLALHMIPGGAPLAPLSKALTIVKDAQPVFANVKRLRAPFTGPNGPSGGLIEEQKRKIEGRIKRIRSLVDVVEVSEQQGVVSRLVPRGREVRNAIAHLDNEAARLNRYGIRQRLLPKIKADIGPMLPGEWLTKFHDMNLDYLFEETLIVHYVRKAVVAEGTWRVDVLDGMNDYQEEYIYKRSKLFRSRVENRDQLIERWGIAKNINRGVGVPPVVIHATKSIPFEKWPFAKRVVPAVE